MSLSKSAVAIFVFSAVSTGVAEASLTGADLAAANSYFKSHPDIVKYAPWIRNGVLTANSLKDANYTLLSNSYYDQAQDKVIYVNQIGGIAPPVSMSTLTPSTPAQVKLTSNIPVVTTGITAVTNTKTTLNEPGVISTPTNTIKAASIVTTTTKQPLIIEPSKAILATHLDGQHIESGQAPKPALPPQKTPVAPQPVLLATHLDGQHIEPGQAPKPSLPPQKTPVAPQPALLATHLDGQHIEPGQAPKPSLPPQKTPVIQIAVDPIKMSIDGSATALKSVQPTHLDGQHNLVINGRDGRPGKNGVTDIITKKEVDTKISKQVNINTQTLKALSMQSTAQAKDLKAAQQVFAQTQTNTHSQFKSLKDEVDGNKKEARGGVASAVAMASMPQVEKDQAVMFSAGAGEFKGEEAVSVGASFHAGSAVVKAGMSDSTNNDFAMGVGVGIGF
ncbi:YadA C-terminal domain-containing protein [Enterobacter sichuanensis]|uniref:YadA C-terminal domain-containing protein n=1 Tax=Enterobacter sichuanensis TaxID=2071710 RepID=UPI0021D0F099|nr:YadA-like family protein [Enterobacter sichuanensis]MCU6190860.1 YadA-like family protein [Enterobacter sichuanensis]